MMIPIRILTVFVMLCALFPTLLAGTRPMPEKHEFRWLYSIHAGVLAHDVDDLWSGTRKEGGVDLNAEIIFVRAGSPLLFGNVRPNLGFTVNTDGDTSTIYAGMLWEFEMKPGISLSLGVGAAVHDGELETGHEDRKSLGSRFLFRIPLEIGYTFRERHRISALFAHISNANLTDLNEGLDTLGLRYGYRF